MTEIEWIYRRDDVDLTLHNAAALQSCANHLETVLLQKAFSAGGVCKGHFPPETVLSFYPQIVATALDVLHLEAYRAAQRGGEDYRHLLARVGTPPTLPSPHSTDEHDIGYWPQADWPATRKDLLHFYLLVRAEYVDLKARLQARPVSPEALQGLAEAACRLIGSQMAAPEAIADFRNELIRSWQCVEWSPPEESSAVNRQS